jgi:hypothetical protein
MVEVEVRNLSETKSKGVCQDKHEVSSYNSCTNLWAVGGWSLNLHYYHA